jgi:predicted O-methyltransferase YrrM
VVRDDADGDSVTAIRRLNDTITADDRVDTAMVAIADGLMFARKR